MNVAHVNESTMEDLEWWKDKAFVKELNKGYADWKSGKEKGYTTEVVDAEIEQSRNQS
jgi:hypothetical protein